MTAILPFPAITSAERVRGLLSVFTRKLPSKPVPCDVERAVRNRLAGYPESVVNVAARKAVALAERHSAEIAIESAARSVENFSRLPPNDAA